jgi:hypothetical protein
LALQHAKNRISDKNLFKTDDSYYEIQQKNLFNSGEEREEKKKSA